MNESELADSDESDGGSESDCASLESDAASSESDGESDAASSESNGVSSDFLDGEVSDIEAAKEKFLLEAADTDTSDEEEIRNTIGNIPMEWYDELAHLGYDIEGKRIPKPLTAGGDEVRGEGIIVCIYKCMLHLIVG